nr:hypothetical protein [Geomonas oryzae]
MSYTYEPPNRGAHFYVHLTRICDVVCDHCMYSSDGSNTSGARMRLEDVDIELALQYIIDSTPAKITISGGGEPFLELDSLLQLLQKAHCPYIEIDTAANWAGASEVTKRILKQICSASRRNPSSPRLIIRASIDKFHMTAFNPVPLEAYVNLVHAWLPFRDHIELGFRGLILEDDRSVEALADALGGGISSRDSCNKVISLPGHVTLPVTFNVLRFTGKGSQLQKKLADRTLSLQQYFAPFEDSPERLVLSRAINDAVKAKYYPYDGVSITLDYDGSLHVFTATAPDRRCNIRTHTFAESLKWFYGDPITRVLLSEGPYWLCETLQPVAPSLVADALRRNDVCSLVETLLSDARICGFVTAIALKALINSGLANPLTRHVILDQLQAASFADLQLEAIQALGRDLQ